MDRQLTKAFTTLTTLLSILSALSFLHAAYLYNQDPFGVGNEAIKDQMCNQLLAGGGCIVIALTAFVLMNLLARSKGLI